MSYWEKVNSISDLKALSLKELEVYADEIREHIIDVVQKNGGHLASNLGTVELTLALHYVFDVPCDKIVWDVGHQSYTHKIVTGRRDSFSDLRKNGGISGFPKPSESECDSFIGGHSSTSLSAALGLARARDLKGDNYNVIGVIGDGAMTGGMAYEAINDIGECQEKMIIVLNDNKMSISPNVGAFSNYLARLRLSKRYARFKHNLKRGVAALPFFGDKLVGMFERTRDNLKSIILSNKLFENFGIKYYGPFDGHNIKNTIEIFKQVKNENRPVLIHLVTNKGNGYEIAETDAEKFHGLSPKSEGQTYCFSEIVGSKLCEMAKTDKRVVAVTAAMKSGTGLEKFFEQFPERAFDVAIAEQHAVTMAAGMAKGGLKPYFAVYSSFLQRGFDQIVHDVCYDNLPVTFLIDRAGAVGADGITHQGILDLSYLGMIPNMTVLAPKDGDELEDMLEFSLTCDSPLAIRYPKSFTAKYEKNTLASVTEWETIKESDKNKYILAVGNRALDAAAAVDDVNVINARCVKPLDTKLLSKIGNGSVVLTLEDNVVSGGFGASVLEYFSKENANVKVISLGYNGFVDDMNTESSLRTAGLCGENIKKLLK
jgi:1-deoxy-D-xylulose-5-phosphate synthase